jgi:hypothetical protein
MKTIGLVLISFIRFCLSDSLAPNIIIILTDDQGFGDLSFNCENSTGMCADMPNLSAFAKSPGSAVFHRFYAAAALCSPTRAAILTGRNNQRDCIASALPCDTQNLAPLCAQGSEAALPTSEFTFADAAKKSGIGDYATLHLGKWHLGDLWDKHLPDMNENWPVSAPWQFGFDEWLTTQAETSSTQSNCGCFPKYHLNPGPRPEDIPFELLPLGDECVVGGGYYSDWCYNCTNYYYANASDPRNVSSLAYKVPGDDSLFLFERFQEFMLRQVQAHKPFLAHICLHTIHEPHPALPENHARYQNDPEYLGALHQLDDAFGFLLESVREAGGAGQHHDHIHLRQRAAPGRRALGHSLLHDVSAGV